VLPARAQESNRVTLERLALACLAEAPGNLDTFRLAAPDSLPYLRTALTNAWLGRGNRIVLGDSTGADVPVLRYHISDARVDYRRLRRNTYRREVAIRIDYSVVGADGMLQDDGLCADSAVDTVRVADLALLEDRAFPETVGNRPEGGFLRRIIEPAVLVSAVAVGVFLFFSLRSDQSSE
jgi:hypothetical protein